MYKKLSHQLLHWQIMLSKSIAEIRAKGALPYRSVLMTGGGAMWECDWGIAMVAAEAIANQF